MRLDLYLVTVMYIFLYKMCSSAYSHTEEVILKSCDGLCVYDIDPTRPLRSDRCLPVGLNPVGWSGLGGAVWVDLAA